MASLVAHISSLKITYGQCETEGFVDGRLVGLLLGWLEGYRLGFGVGANVGLYNFRLSVA